MECGKHIFCTVFSERNEMSEGSRDWIKKFYIKTETQLNTELVMGMMQLKFHPDVEQPWRDFLIHITILEFQERKAISRYFK